MTAYKLPNCLEITEIIDGKLRLFKRTFNPPLMKYCGGINEKWRSSGKVVNLKRKDEIIYGNEIAKLIGKKDYPSASNSTKVLSALKELRDSFTEEERKTLFED